MAGRLMTLAELRGIETAEQFRAFLGSLKAVRLELVRQGLRAVPPVLVDATAAPAVARVNHGDWIADCPTPRCGGSTVLMRGEPFICGRCLNAEIGNRWRRVTWPKDAGAIEAILTRQPSSQLRNWDPEISGPALAAAVESELRGERPRHVRELRKGGR